MHKKKISFELKSTHLSLVTFVLKSADINLIQDELIGQFGNQSDYFENEPAILDLTFISCEEIDFTQLLKVLKRYQLSPFAVSHASTVQLQKAAKQAGLLVFSSDITSHSASEPQKTSPVQATASPMLVDKPLRSGQQFYARGSDLIITSLVSHGAEVIADGSIHVYAPLRGKAIAGAQGNINARIFTTCFEPALYSIAGVFQTTEQQLPENVRGKPAMVRLENNMLIVTPL
ncbi:MAG: septum site-determining protein MinC [Saezia sp.]